MQLLQQLYLYFWWDEQDSLPQTYNFTKSAFCKILPLSEGLRWIRVAILFITVRPWILARPAWEFGRYPMKEAGPRRRHRQSHTRCKYLSFLRFQNLIASSFTWAKRVFPSRLPEAFSLSPSRDSPRSSLSPRAGVHQQGMPGRKGSRKNTKDILPWSTALLWQHLLAWRHLCSISMFYKNSSCLGFYRLRRQLSLLPVAKILSGWGQIGHRYPGGGLMPEWMIPDPLKRLSQNNCIWHQILSVKLTLS